MAASKKETTRTVNKFTKEQIVNSKRYMSYVDFLSGNLQDGKTYTTEQVDKMIAKFYGKDKSE